MATNTSGNFTGDVVKYIEQKVLPLTRRQLVAYQFATPATLPKGMGTTYTATRYNRLTLPFAPLSEGVPPIGESMSISQVSGVMQQWGDKVTITDVAEMTIFHPIFKQAMRLTALQMAESNERRIYLTLMGGTQVNYVNKRGSRAALQVGDVLDPFTINRTSAALVTIGAPRFMGDEETDAKIDAKSGGKDASQDPRRHAHYVAICHPLVVGDFSDNPTVQTAWSYSDINRLYNYEAGEWRGITFCMSNMVPFWTGIAAVTGATGTTGGSLASGTTYYLQVTGSNAQNQYESQIYQVDGGEAPGSSNTALSLTLPSTPGYTYSVYIGTSAAGVSNLALTNSTAAPQSGPYSGVATQLPPGTTVTLTGFGPQQVPPAAPATGVTVYPTFVFGRDFYSWVTLDSVKMTYLTQADKSDPLNQLRVIGWKQYDGGLITNNQFGARIESTSSYSSNFG
jgi:N4-gp56 family major capsid protein